MNALIDIAALAEQLRRVTVEVTDAGELLGSGVLWPAGCVVTNAHVVRRPEATLRLRYHDRTWPGAVSGAYWHGIQFGNENGSSGLGLWSCSWPWRR